MEFLRFGSSIPGSYWGCCAMDIIQDFNQDPDTKTSIQLVSGDGGNPVMLNNEIAFAGPTYRDVFNQRIRFGTFDKRDMPNHGFLAILTENQVNGKTGKKWLAILRETGFEFLRSVSNSVYQGASLGKPSGTGSSMNHLFGLFRNIGSGASADPYTPPKAWSSLPRSVPELWEHVPRDCIAPLVTTSHDAQTDIWNKIGPPKLLTEAEVIAAGAPVVLAGLRTQFPQQTKEQRESIKASLEKSSGKAKPDSKIDPFAAVIIAAPIETYEDECCDDYDGYDEEYEDDFNCGETDCQLCA